MINWKMLDINPTDDKAVIKKAYAKQLRIYHPEDNPEEYQRLREAYDAAMKQAGKPEHFAGGRSRPEIALPMLVEDAASDSDRLNRVSLLSSVMEPEIIDDMVYGSQDDVEDESLAKLRLDPLQLFWQELHERYRDFSRRVDPQQWETLTKEDFMWDVGSVEKRFDVLIRFLTQNRYMPLDVWIMLDSMFELSNNFEYMQERYDNDVIEYITLQISGALELGYECLLDRQLECDVDDYLRLREEAQFFLMRRQLEDAQQRLVQANELFQEDPDLQLMRAKLALMNGTSNEALDILNQVISYNPKEWEAYLLRGRLLFNWKKYIEAQQDAELLLQHVPDSQDVICLAMECRIALNQLEGAWAIKHDSNKAHFRYYAVMMALCNKHLHSQKSRKKTFNNTLNVMGYRILDFFLLLWKLNWLLLFIYAASGFFIGFGSLPAYVAVGAMLWRTWKAIRTTYLLLT
ncbi:hypothetical protein [Paenibacillus sp. UMB4589-SE434]|uniref:J domain-containing protein n=1 Tax=Paenibacillus sp. UMB4589-SE434 TaxID=3046314 RepID=UPI002549FE03|nr:hypothetical protein [Paenibacillus sp. UMB4589-SE434]MDK8180502.1 hypothetical protein [Paenibacillus sp. UMB4589-SE434]